MTTPSTRVGLGSPVVSPDPGAKLHHLLTEQLRTHHALRHAKARAFLHHLGRKGVSISEARARALLDTEDLADETWRAWVEARVAVLTLSPSPVLDAVLGDHTDDQDRDDAF
jgi:hypothetical protein